MKRSKLIRTLAVQALAAMTVCFGLSACTTVSLDPKKPIAHSGNWFTGHTYSQKFAETGSQVSDPGEKVLNRDDMVSQLYADFETHDLIQSHHSWKMTGYGLAGVAGGLLIASVITANGRSLYQGAPLGLFIGAGAAVLLEAVAFGLSEAELYRAVRKYNQRFEAVQVLLDGQNFGAGLSWRF